MTYIRILPALVLACVFSTLQAEEPKTFLLNPGVLTKVRQELQQQNSAYQKAFDKLREDADKASKQTPLSVMDKKQTPPSGDKHDYMSLAPYWWPDPKKPDGLPYIRRDGEVNPEREEFTDRDHIRTTISSVFTLSAAYYFTRHEPYAEHAARLLRTWFLDSATRMNPNVNFGQAIKGRTKGRGAGLIETSGFRFIVDALGLLEGSASWSASDRTAMKNWFEEYFVWLRSSEVGLDESDSKNNHGTWYDVQCASIALYLGKSDTARAILAEAKAKRVASQIEPDGRMPLELARTKALGYTTMNIDG
ncbi:MAG: alginate lyase family protein, partial [Ignavibacteriae bacterium]|nr:alginate lyase family protein [Ignavibacteriota bacterium]